MAKQNSPSIPDNKPPMRMRWAHKSRLPLWTCSSTDNKRPHSSRALDWYWRPMSTRQLSSLCMQQHMPIQHQLLCLLMTRWSLLKMLPVEKIILEINNRIIFYYFFFGLLLTIQYTDDEHVAIVCDDNVDAEYVPEQHVATGGKLATVAVAVAPAMHVA